MRKLTIIFAVMLAACGGASEQDLTEAVAPLDEARELLEDFQFKIEGGLTYGAIMEQWPDTSAEVRRSLQNFEIDSALPEGDQVDILAYQLALAGASDQLSKLVEAVRGYIRDDEPESGITSALTTFYIHMDTVDSVRTDAITPGDSRESDDDT